MCISFLHAVASPVKAALQSVHNSRSGDGGAGTEGEAIYRDCDSADGERGQMESGWALPAAVTHVPVTAWDTLQPHLQPHTSVWAPGTVPWSQVNVSFLADRAQKRWRGPAWTPVPLTRALAVKAPAHFPRCFEQRKPLSGKLAPQLPWGRGG